MDILLYLYAVVAPGIAIAWVSLSDHEPLVLGAVGLTLSVLALPLLNFVLAMVLRTHIQPTLVISVGTVLLAACAAVEVRRRRARART